MQAAAPPPGPRPFTWPASSIPRHHGNVCVSPRSSSRRSNSSGSSVCVCVCVCVSVAVYLKQVGGSGSDPAPDEEVSFHLFMEACGTLALALALA